jgi:hypothetical protein
MGGIIARKGGAVNEKRGGIWKEKVRSGGEIDLKDSRRGCVVVFSE